jgi:hypothetical protein
MTCSDCLDSSGWRLREGNSQSSQFEANRAFCEGETGLSLSSLADSRIDQLHHVLRIAHPCGCSRGKHLVQAA